jgi:hypothetical protein
VQKPAPNAAESHAFLGEFDETTPPTQHEEGEGVRVCWLIHEARALWRGGDGRTHVASSQQFVWRGHHLQLTLEVDEEEGDTVYGYVYNHDQGKTVQGDMTWKLATREVPVEVSLGTADSDEAGLGEAIIHSEADGLELLIDGDLHVEAVFHGRPMRVLHVSTVSDGLGPW